MLLVSSLKRLSMCLAMVRQAPKVTTCRPERDKRVVARAVFVLLMSAVSFMLITQLFKW